MSRNFDKNMRTQMKKYLLILLAVAATMTAACSDKGDGEKEPERELVTLKYGAAFYYGDTYGAGTANWVLEIDVMEDDTWHGFSVDLNMEAVYDYAGGGLQEGTYVLGTDGAAKTFAPGAVDEATERVGGSYVYRKDFGKFNYEELYLVEGGTIEIESEGTNRYTVTAKFKTATDYFGNGTTKNDVAYTFVGVPVLYDGVAPTPPDPRPDAALQAGVAFYYGDTGKGSDRWVTQFGYEEGEYTVLYRVEINAEKSYGLTLPVGTFEMAAEAGLGVAGTVEPYVYDEEDFVGTCFITYHQETYVNELGAVKGNLTITDAGGGNYLAQMTFEDKDGNVFGGTYEGTVGITGNAPREYEIDDWNGDGSIIDFYGSNGGANNFYLMLCGEGVSIDGAGNPVGEGVMLELDLFTPLDLPEAGYIPLGVYTVDTEGTMAPWTIDAVDGYAGFYEVQPEPRYGGAALTGGAVEFKSRTGDEYTIALDLQLGDGSTLKGTFVGAPQYGDYSQPAASRVRRNLAPGRTAAERSFRFPAGR